MAIKKTKNQKKALALIDKTKSYELTEAIDLVKKITTTKFDASVDVAIKMNLDTTKAEQQLRGAISLPYHVGKPIRILAITDNHQSALEAGADFVGDLDKIADIKNGWLDFDLIITKPKFMAELGKLGKILGPKGLMPNPKTGTVSENIEQAIKEYKKGKKEYRTDSFGNIHMSVGKVSTATEQLKENIQSLIDLIKTKRPSTVKGVFIQNIFLSSTMSPGIKVKIPE